MTKDNEADKIEQAFDILNECEVMHVFEDVIWVSIDKEAFEDWAEVKFNKDETDD